MVELFYTLVIVSMVIIVSVIGSVLRVMFNLRSVTITRFYIIAFLLGLMFLFRESAGFVTLLGILTGLYMVYAFFATIFGGILSFFGSGNENVKGGLLGFLAGYISAGALNKRRTKRQRF